MYNSKLEGYPVTNLLTLLLGMDEKSFRYTNDGIYENIEKFNRVFESFNIDAKVSRFIIGRSVIMYEVTPGPGVPVDKIISLENDIKLHFNLKSIRITHSITGNAALGIEIPLQKRSPVSLPEVIDSDEFNNEPTELKIPIGKDILGRTIVATLDEMPHILIAGATGSGKTMFLNSIIMSLIMKHTPYELKFILIDPKMVEFEDYAGLPHLMADIATDMKKALCAINWAENEMQERYKKFQSAGAKDMARYNTLSAELGHEKLPYIVIIVDELSDLMAFGGKDCEALISRLAAMSRAVGIYLILATSRPSPDVATDLIKANFSSRIAFQTASVVDSRTIIDQNGAESLLGSGDILFKTKNFPNFIRVQGAYVSDAEIERITQFITTHYNDEKWNRIYFELKDLSEKNEISENNEICDDDELLNEAMRIVVSSQQGSVALLRRKLNICHHRAIKLMTLLEKKGVVGPSLGPNPRQVLIDKIEMLKTDQI